MSNLPEDFLCRMRRMLGDQYEDFLTGYDKDREYGLRRNPLKAGTEEFEKLDFGLRSVPWAEEGYYYDSAARPGRHPYHEAGVYYIQEPSAMSVAELLEVKPGDRVLDLCAAPGGKSTQLAGKMHGEGLLVSNEIMPARAKILSQNIERFGASNVVVLNEPSDRLADRFEGFFDKIIVDAPCSGEGMFRKDDNAADEWSSEQVDICAERQLMIIKNAARMLKAGGVMVYSTCTFAPQENEGVISRFIQSDNEFTIQKCNVYEGFDHGHGEWIDNPCDGIEDTIRLWPHKLGGEGHYAAKLKKADGINREYGLYNNYNKKTDILEYKAFSKEFLNVKEDKEGFMMFGDQLYRIPKEMININGLKVVRPGLHLGTNKKNRFEPAHALALSLSSQDVVNCINLTVDEALRYLHGETLECEDQKGWTLVMVDGFSLGWGKCVNGTLKNHYPKGLRINWSHHS